MDLKSFSLKLRMELQNDPTPEKAEEIAKKIITTKHTDGTYLSEAEKGHILMYIQYPGYDHKTGKGISLEHADNSEFLKLVALITKNINSK